MSTPDMAALVARLRTAAERASNHELLRDAADALGRLGQELDLARSLPPCERCWIAERNEAHARAEAVRLREALIQLREEFGTAEDSWAPVGDAVTWQANCEQADAAISGPSAAWAEEVAALRGLEQAARDFWSNPTMGGCEKVRAALARLDAARAREER